MGRNLAKARERKLWRILALQRPYKEAYTIARLDATARPMGRTVAMGLITARSEAGTMNKWCERIMCVAILIASIALLLAVCGMWYCTLNGTQLGG